MREASQEREGNRRGGGGEDSVDCRGGEAGKGAGAVWTGGKADKMTPAPPCARRGRGDEVGDFCVELGVRGGDPASTGDLS